MRERLAEVAASETQAEERRADTRKEREATHQRLEEVDAELTALDTELRQRRTVAADHKQLSLDLFSTEAEKRNACERTRERIAYLNERRAAARARLDEMEHRAGELDQMGRSGAERRAAIESDIDVARARLAETERGLAALADALRGADHTLGGRRQELAALESRLDTLQELKRNFEGVSEGVKQLFAEGKPEGVIGVVADVVEVPARYLDALEASLGEASAFVLVDGPQALMQTLDRLRDFESGRATLLDVAALSPGTPTPLP
jgi:chromosome segregation protein